MNDMNQLEKQLESWTPRRPSPKLRRQLFPVAAAPRNESAPVAALWLSTAVAACVFLMTAWLELPRPSHNRMIITAVGDSNLIASLALAERSCPQNIWSAVTFDWTNAGSSPSILRSSGLGRTNL